MAKTYEILHNGDYVPATFVKDSSDVEFVFLEYEHIDHDEESGEPLEAVTKQIHIRTNDPALRVTETEE
jgi:hypothetical protein